MNQSSSSMTPQNRFPKEMMVATMLVILIWGLWAGQAFFIPISLASLLAFLASPLLRFLRSKHFPEWLAIITSCCLFLIPVGLVGFLLLRQAQSLLVDYPTIVASLQKFLVGITKTSWGQKFHLDQHLTMDSLVKHVGAGAGEGVKFFVHGLSKVFEASTELVLVFLFAAIMLGSREHIYKSSEKILERFESIEAPNLLKAVTDMIEKFLLTKLLVIAIISILSFAALQILGLKYALLLGITTGVLTLVPEVGFAISLVPVAIVAIATGHSAISIAGLLGSMVVVHLIEANIFTPKLVGKKLNLNILSTFLGLFAGGLLWGAWGMLLSVPILGVLRIIFSASPALQPIAFLLSEKEDKQFGLGLMNKALRAKRLRFLLSRERQHHFSSNEA